MKKRQFSPWRNRLICVILTLIILLVVLGSESVFRSSKNGAISSNFQERRGVWLTNVASSVFFVPGSINRAIKQLAEHHFNTVYPVVWNRGHTFYPNYLQDWKTWVRRGLIDELVLQVYRNDLNSFNRELHQSAVKFARQKIPVSIGILSGTLNNTVKIEQIKQQVETVRKQGFDGVSFFYWESLWGYLTPESPYKRRRIFDEMFSEL